MSEQAVANVRVFGFGTTRRHLFCQRITPTFEVEVLFFRVKVDLVAFWGFGPVDERVVCGQFRSVFLPLEIIES